MKKEHKCHSCHLSYRGIKTQCPTCHKKTPLGKFNVFMCVVGYICTISLLYVLLEYLFAVLFASTVLAGITLLPLILTAVIVAVIAIVIYICVK